VPGVRLGVALLPKNAPWSFYIAVGSSIGPPLNKRGTSGGVVSFQFQQVSRDGRNYHIKMFKDLTFRKLESGCQTTQ